jgi:hypothetical protein
MTFATLRALHKIIGDAIDEIEEVYNNSASHTAQLAGISLKPGIPIDFPSLDLPFDAGSSSEALVSHPAVAEAVSRIVAAAGQIATTAEMPFNTVMNTGMSVCLLNSLY